MCSFCILPASTSAYSSSPKTHMRWTELTAGVNVSVNTCCLPPPSETGGMQLSARQALMEKCTHVCTHHFAEECVKCRRRPGVCSSSSRLISCSCRHSRIRHLQARCILVTEKKKRENSFSNGLFNRQSSTVPGSLETPGETEYLGEKIDSEKSEEISITAQQPAGGGVDVFP